VVLLLGTLAWAGETETRQKIYEQIAIGAYAPARAAIDKYLKTYPDSEHVPWLRLAHALTYRSSDQWFTRGRHLRQLAEEYPDDTFVGRRARRLLEEDKDLKPGPSEFPSRIDPRSRFWVEQDDDRSSQVRIFFVQPAEARKHLLRVQFEKLSGSFAQMLDGVPREHVGTFDLDFGNGREYLEAGLKRPGLYLIEENRAGVIHRHEMWVTGKPYYAKVLGEEAILFAAGKCSFTLRTASGGVRELETDTTGFKRFAVTEKTLVLIREEWFVITPNAKKHERVLISTDRPIYRPGQTVHFKAVKRDVVLGALRLPVDRSVRLEVRDPRGRVLQKTEYAWSDAGTAVGEFRLPDEPSIGRYAIFADVDRPRDPYNEWWWDVEDLSGRWNHSFEVAAYRKPEMTVRIEFLERKGRTIRARLHAEYLFGGAVSKAEVSWTASAEPYWDDDDRSASAPLPDPDAWWIEALDTEPDYGWWGEPVAEGVVEIAEDGTAEIEISDDWEPDRLRLVATVTDASNRAATGTKWLPGFAGAMRLEVGCDRRWYEVGDEVTVTVQARTSDGSPVAGAEVDVSCLLYADDGFERVFARKVATGPDGNASFKSVVKEAGEFRVIARAKGSRPARRVYEVVDVDAPDSGDTWRELGDIRVIPDQLTYRPGDKMELFLQAPTRCRGFLTVESDRFHLVRRIDFERPVRIVTLEIDASFAPRAIVKFVAFRGAAINSYGAEFFVLPHENRLGVEISADRSEYTPGGTAKITVDTEQAAEVELAIVDQAVFELKPDAVPDPFTFFFAARLHETEVFGSFDGGPYDDWDQYDEVDSEEPMFGGAAEPVSPFDGPPEGGGPVRRKFPDTMFYAGRVQTDAAGRATVEVPVPDSLTRWVIVARAVAGADRFGVGRSEILTRKDVITRISAPRFLTIGDETEVGVIVHNHLGKAQEFVVRFGDEEHRVSIAAGAHTRLGWKMRAEAVGDLTLSASAVATGGAGGDTVEITLPVLTRTVALSDRFGARVETTWRQRLEPGEIEILVGGSHQEAIRDALPYLVGYPYGCVEQTMSRFLPAVVATKAMRGAGMRVSKVLPDLISIGLTRLYDFQHDDGGWGWWRDDQTDDWMTAYVVHGLLTARDAGQTVDEKTIERGLELLRDDEMKPTPFGLYVRSLAGDEIDPKTVPEPKSVRDRAYLALAGLGELGALHDFEPTRTSEVALVLRARAAEKDGAVEVARWAEWLLSHRRGGRWNSTLDTAHAILALSHVPVSPIAETADVTLGGKPLKLENGRAVLQLDAPADLVVTRASGSLMFASAVRRYRAEPKAFAHERFTIARRFEKRVGEKWQPVATDGAVAVRDKVRLVVTIDVQQAAEFMMIDVPLPGGVETSLSLADAADIWFGHLEARDDRIEIAAKYLGKGAHTITLPVQLIAAGKYHTGPARAFAMYDEDQQSRSEPFTLVVR